VSANLSSSYRVANDANVSAVVVATQAVAVRCVGPTGALLPHCQLRNDTQPYMQDAAVLITKPTKCLLV